MSLTGDRQEIATSLSTVDGVKGSKYRPNVIMPGSAWPLLGPLERDEGSGQFAATWRIAVALPGDEQRASEWFDAHHEEIAEALEEFGYVERIEPGLIDTEAGDMEAMIITLRREA
jgi:hypothetical protein